MISCKLYGRTGNQLFQIAATIGHAWKYGYKYAFPQFTENPDIWPKVEVTLPVLKDTETFTGEHKEPFHKYSEIPKMDNIILDGYFQSYKYFQDILPILSKLLNFSNVTIWNTIALHIRRGDYLLYPDKHPILPMSYYQTAIEYIISKEPRRIFDIIVMTDDPDWCRENVTLDKFGFDVQIRSSKIPEQDLKVMAKCQHNIIANSSFSYWAAILNPNPQKIVITPVYTKWFGEGNKHLDTSDLLPNEWIQIDYDDKKK
jgi:hypothetical protein